MMTRRQPTTRHKRVFLAIAAATVLSTALLTACGSDDPTANANEDQDETTTEGPQLDGEPIRVVIPASPSVKDTTLFLQAQILESWGADASVVNQVGSSDAIRAVIAGQGEFASVAVAPILNSDAVAYGPSQPGLDYHLVGAEDVKSIDDIRGRVYGTASPNGLEALMFASMLKNQSIDPGDVEVRISGGSSTRVGAMLTEQIDLTWAHASDLGTLESAGINDLGSAAELAPDITGPFTASTREWYEANPELAIAVNQAWIEAARIFHDDPEQWISAAVEYSGKDAETAAEEHQLLMEQDIFPLSPDVFSAATGEEQGRLAAEVGAVEAERALDTWFDTTAWDEAVKRAGLK